MNEMETTRDRRSRSWRCFTHLACLLLLASQTAVAALNDSPYTIPVSIPPYDPGNSEHFLISSTSDWSHINDTDKRFFYVEPHANYGQFTITADGTESQKKYLSLHNGNDLHPGKLDPSQQANVSLTFDRAKHWVVDRMSSLDHTSSEYAFIVKNHSEHVVLNRLYLNNFTAGVSILGTVAQYYTTDITLQNSRLDRMSDHGLDSDRVAIFLNADPWDARTVLVNTKILNNEVRNTNDGILVVRNPNLSSGPHDVDYPGTIIDHNHIYIDNEIYSDGNGNHDPNGKWAFAEQAIDLKAGSKDPNNPLIVSNNTFWGFRTTDSNGGGSGSWGDAFNGHFGADHLEIKNNVIFDSNRSITFGAPRNADYSTMGTTVSGNLVYDIGHNTPDTSMQPAHFALESKDVVFEKNTIVDDDKQSRWFNHGNNELNLTVSENVLINSFEMTGSRAATTVVEQNTFYDTLQQNVGDGTSYASATDAQMVDLTFMTDTYTNAPRQITLPGVVSTLASPHVLAGHLKAPGDLDGDLDVDGSDFLRWQLGYRNTSVGNDLPYDKSDLADWRSNFGGDAASLATGMTVPEPSSLLWSVLVLWGAVLRPPRLVP